MNSKSKLYHVKPIGDTSKTSHRTSEKSPNHTHQARTSKLSQGPKNPHHKTYLCNDDLIGNAICAQLSKRRIDIKAKEIYTNAGVTSPTFYLHYRNIDEARHRYERKLINRFCYSLPSNPKPETIYICLTSFIAKHQNYFLATAAGDDYYLLKRIITKYRRALTGKDTTDRTFRYYTSFIVTSINCWLELDGITPETTKACSSYLIKIHPMRYWEK